MNIDLEGIRIPDSKLAREIMELVRDTESPVDRLGIFDVPTQTQEWQAPDHVADRRGQEQQPGAEAT